MRQHLCISEKQNCDPKPAANLSTMCTLLGHPGYSGYPRNPRALPIGYVQQDWYLHCALGTARTTGSPIPLWTIQNSTAPIPQPQSRRTKRTAGRTPSRWRRRRQSKAGLAAHPGPAIQSPTGRAAAGGAPARPVPSATAVCWGTRVSCRVARYAVFAACTLQVAHRQVSDGRCSRAMEAPSAHRVLDARLPDTAQRCARAHGARAHGACARTRTPIGRPVCARVCTHAHRMAREALGVCDADRALEGRAAEHFPQRVDLDLYIAQPMRNIRNTHG